MTFTYAQVKERSKLLLAMPGLTQAAFEHLLPAFAKAWAEYVRQTSMEREDRQRQYGGGRAETTLGAIEEKLLCILYYVKVYPLQEILAFEFGMTPSTANEWIHLRSGVLKNALEEEGSLPVRDPQQGASVLEAARHRRMASMGRNGDGNGQTIQTNNKSITVGKKSTHGQESPYWRA